jgi:hypothetical protein
LLRTGLRINSVEGPVRGRSLGEGWYNVSREQGLGQARLKLSIAAKNDTIGREIVPFTG